MKTKYKFIEFDMMPEDDRGCVFYSCLNRKTGDCLGFVEYYKDWRQYCFEPADGAIFSSSCLADIQHFLGQLNKKD